MSINIAIDGPAGAGKSTIAKRLSGALQYVYVDTGAMYRAMAYYFLKAGVNSDDECAIEREVSRIDISIVYRDGEQQVLLNGANVNAYLRTEEVGKMASCISVYPSVRAKLTQLQQQLASKENVIMDGRDIGTAVLPNAQVKIYLTASSNARARRRYEELRAKGEEISFETIEADIIERDERDMNRAVSPLKQAEDAILVDSSNMGVEEVVEEIQKIIKDKCEI